MAQDEWIDEFDRKYQKLKEAREAIASIALDSWLERHPQSTITEMMDHFFPPNPLIFDQGDLRAVIRERLHDGTLELDIDRKLRQK